jgi:hypothetical protein
VESVAVGVELGELAIQRDQHFVDDAPNQARRMRRRNPVLQVNIRKQVATPLIRSAHPRLPIGTNTGIIFARPYQPAFSAAWAAQSRSDRQLVSDQVLCYRNHASMKKTTFC